MMHRLLQLQTMTWRWWPRRWLRREEPEEEGSCAIPIAHLVLKEMTWCSPFEACLVELFVALCERVS